MRDEYLKSLVSQVKDAKETKGKNDLERIIAEQKLKIKNLEAISKVHQKQNGELQVRINELDINEANNLKRLLPVIDLSLIHI